MSSLLPLDPLLSVRLRQLAAALPPRSGHLETVRLAIDLALRSESEARPLRAVEEARGRIGLPPAPGAPQGEG